MSAEQWTEEDWLEENEPGHLVNQARCRKKMRKRRARLYAAGCCRQIWHRLPEVPCRQAVEVAERYADRRASPKELAEAQRSLAPDGKVTRGLLEPLRTLTATECDMWFFLWHLDRWAQQQAFQNLGVASPWRQNWNERLCCLVRDVIGNPYRPMAVNSSWLTANVTAIAQALYAERRFEDMPILADALEEAGCTDPAILEHCREQGRTFAAAGWWICYCARSRGGERSEDPPKHQSSSVRAVGLREYA